MGLTKLGILIFVQHGQSWRNARAEQSGAERSRAEQSTAQQSRAEKSRAEQSRAERSRAEQSRAERSRAERSRAECSTEAQNTKRYTPLKQRLATTPAASGSTHNRKRAQHTTKGAGMLTSPGISRVSSGPAMTGSVISARMLVTTAVSSANAVLPPARCDSTKSSVCDKLLRVERALQSARMLVCEPIDAAQHG